MSKRDYVRQELADIEGQLEGQDPDMAGEDMTDLAAIGLARYNPKITPKQIAGLVAEARSYGRSWDQIGSRLGMSADEARKAYEHPSSKGLIPAAVGSGMAAAIVLALRHLLRNLGGIPRA
jgi:hypothetical protein